MAMLSESVVYVGGFVDWQPSGQGTRYQADGSVYRGQWEGGTYHGIGELRFESADAAEAAAEAEVRDERTAILQEADKAASEAVEKAMDKVEAMIELELHDNDVMSDDEY